MTTPSTQAQRKADRRALTILAAAMFALFAGPIFMAEAFYAEPIAEQGK